jgi:hypothetical protein
MGKNMNRVPYMGDTHELWGMNVAFFAVYLLECFMLRHGLCLREVAKLKNDR